MCYVTTFNTLINSQKPLKILAFKGFFLKLSVKLGILMI